jgi:hypothetical protein
VSDPNLTRLLTGAHDAVQHLPYDTDAVSLYRRAADRAELLWPDPFGRALAATLALAAHEREASGLRGMLGLPHPVIALALAVLDLETS